MPPVPEEKDPWEQIRVERVPCEYTRTVLEHIVNVGSDERHARIRMFKSAMELADRLHDRHTQHENVLQKMTDDFHQFRAADFAEALTLIRKIETALIGDAVLQQKGLGQRVADLEELNAAHMDWFRRHELADERARAAEEIDNKWYSGIRKWLPMILMFLLGMATLWIRSEVQEAVENTNKTETDRGPSSDR